jgi:hypothetical protein
MDNTKAVHWILGVALLMIGVFVVAALVMVNSQADDVTTSASIDNVAPTITSVFTSDAQYDLTDDYGGDGGTLTGIVNAGTTGELHINGVVADTNGDDDIASVAVKFYRSAMGGSCSAGDDNYCYIDDTDSNCALDTTYGDDTQAKFDCQFNINYYADATDANSDNYTSTDWTVEVYLLDDDASSAEDTSLQKVMPTLRSLSIPSTISFGTMALGASLDAGEGEQMSIEQYGNDEASVEVSMASDMTCDSSDAGIPKANIEWALSDAGIDNGTDLTTSAADTSIDIGLRTDGVVTDKLYWFIEIPASGVEGECTGTTVITTVNT